MPEWDDEDDNDSNLVKQLRAQLKEAQKTKGELEKEIGMLRPQVRATSLKSVLSEIGVNPKIAALLPSDVEPTKEAVSEWLKEYGELFNVKGEASEVAAEKAEAEDTAEPLAGQKQETVLPPDIQEQWARIQSGESATGTTSPDIEKQQVAHLGRAVAAAGGNFDSFVELLRGDRPLPS